MWLHINTRVKYNILWMKYACGSGPILLIYLDKIWVAEERRKKGLVGKQDDDDEQNCWLGIIRRETKQKIINERKSFAKMTEICQSSHCMGTRTARVYGRLEWHSIRADIRIYRMMVVCGGTFVCLEGPTNASYTRNHRHNNKIVLAAPAHGQIFLLFS